MYYRVFRFKDEIIITEQASESDNLETAEEAIFTPDEEQILAQFDANKSDTLGVIYSPSTSGIIDFINRSGWIKPAGLISLVKSGYLKLVNIDSHGSDNYTLKLSNLKLKDIEGFASKLSNTDAADGAGDNMDSGGMGMDSGGMGMDSGGMGMDSGGMDMGGGAPPAPPAEEPPAEEPPAEEPVPGPENASFMKYGNILTESAKITKQLVSEAKRKSYNNVHVDKSRILKKLPSEYIKHLNQLITLVSKKRYNSYEKKQLIADILDNLSLKLKLTPKQIYMSYEMHKNQKKLKDLLDKD